MPRVDVQVSGGYQGLPGLLIAANYNAPLGIPFKVVQIIEPGLSLGDRMNQFDFRISKLLRFSNTRTMVGLDMYNLFNSTPVLTENQTFGPAYGRRSRCCRRGSSSSAPSSIGKETRGIRVSRRNQAVIRQLEFSESIPVS